MRKVKVQPSGHEFSVEEGESVLTAALRQHLVLPYGCRNGACGSCKGKIVEGEVDYGVYQKKALTEADKAQGKALFCQAKPVSDLVIEARTIGAAKDIPIRTLPCRVQKMERLADDVMVLYLKLPANERLQFLAGQYIEFLLKDGSRRSFSMGNAPHDDELIQLHVRRVAGGQFTDHVFGKMKERDILRFEGPLGTFFLREDSQKPIVFVASGTGFAPIKSVIEHALHKGATIGLHTNDKDEVYYVLSGRGELTLEGKVSEVGPGDAILTRNGDSHGLRQLGDEDLVIIVVFPKRPTDP